MATKTITLELDAYERLRSAKRSPRESFSEVVRRLPIPNAAITAGELLAMRRASGPSMSEADCQTIDQVNFYARSNSWVSLAKLPGDLEVPTGIYEGPGR